MHRILVRNGRAFADDRRWGAKKFEHRGDALVSAAEFYDPVYLESQCRCQPERHRPGFRLPRRANLGDFWSQPSPPPV